ATDARPGPVRERQVPVAEVGEDRCDDRRDALRLEPVVVREQVVQAEVDDQRDDADESEGRDLLGQDSPGMPQIQAQLDGSRQGGHDCRGYLPRAAIPLCLSRLWAAG